MSARNRSQNLTADLLSEIAGDEAAPLAGSPLVVPPTARDDKATAPSAFLETSLFLAPSTWLRPGIARSGATVSLSAGPVRLRAGRG